MLNWLYKLKSDHRGAVTVFVTLILIPSIAFTGFFVDFARVKLYKQQAISTVDTYANSVLSYYDGILQDIYGLYGISKDGLSDEIDKALQSYAKTAFNPNEYHAQQTNVEKLIDKFTNGSSVTGFMPYAKAEVSFEHSPIDGMNLSNPKVLTNQIADYSKYAVPLELLKSAISSLNNNSQNQDDDTESENTEDGDKLLDSIDDQSTSPDSKLLNEKNKLDKQLKELSQKCNDYYNDLIKINEYLNEDGIKNTEDKCGLAYLLDDFKVQIIDIIQGKGNNDLIPFINAKNEEYAEKSNTIKDERNQLNDYESQLETLKQSNDYKLYQNKDNEEIQKFNKLVDTYNNNHTDDNTFNEDKPSSSDVTEYNNQCKTYNKAIDDYLNNQNIDLSNTEDSKTESVPKKYELKYEIDNFEEKLTTLQNDINKLKQSISSTETELSKIENDIKTKIDTTYASMNGAHTNIIDLIDDFSVNTIKRLEDYKTYINGLTLKSSNIDFCQSLVQDRYNECQRLLQDNNVSIEVREQVEAELSQVEPLIKYDFELLTKELQKRNEYIINEAIGKWKEFYGDDNKGFCALYNYCNNPIYVNEEKDSNGNISNYVAYHLNSEDYYDPNLKYEFASSRYINLNIYDSNADKWKADTFSKEIQTITLIYMDENNQPKSPEEVGIFEYLKRSYSTTSTPTDSNTPTDEDSANEKAKGKQDAAENDLNSTIDSIKQKLYRSIPDSYWQGFSQGGFESVDKTSPDMSLGEKFNFDYIKQIGKELLDKFFLEEYDYRMFSNYTTKTDNNELTLSYVPIGTQVNYLMNSELEYIYAGKQTAAENFGTVCLQIFAIRFALDFISTYKITEINTLINTIKAAVSSVATPVVGVIVAGIARVLVAMVMAVSDVVKLLGTEENQDHSVVVLQTKFSDLSAYESLKGVFESFGVKFEESKNNEKRGIALKYTDYLRLMILIFRDTNTIATRTGNLIELNINNYITDANANETDGLKNHSFKMSEVQTMIDAKVTIKTDFLFTDFFLTDDFIPNQDTKNSVESFTEQGYSYTLKKGY